MARHQHTPDQITRKLAEGKELLADGATLDSVCSNLEIAKSTWHRWMTRYGDAKANDAKRVEELEGENSRLRRQLADAEQDKALHDAWPERNF